MCNILLWNYKRLKARHEEVKHLINKNQPSYIYIYTREILKSTEPENEDVRLLMNKVQPTCICLQKVMLKTTEYNIEREYKFYATISSGQKSKVQTVIVIIKRPHTRLAIRTTSK